MLRFLTTVDVVKASQRLYQQRSRTVDDDDIKVDVQERVNAQQVAASEFGVTSVLTRLRGTLAEPQHESLDRIGLRARTRPVQDPRCRSSAARETLVFRRSSHSSKKIKTQARRGKKLLPLRARKRWTIKASPRMILLDRIPASQYHFAMMTSCQLHGAEPSTFPLRSDSWRNPARVGTSLADAGRGTLCHTMTTYERDFFLSKKPQKANLSDGRSLDSDSTPKKNGNAQARV